MSHIKAMGTSRNIDESANTPRERPTLAHGAHLINDQAINGYGWLYFQGFPPLFTPAPGATRFRLRFVDGRLDRLEGGTLTPEGQRIFDTLANSEGPVSGAIGNRKTPELWSDDPNRCVRFQVHEGWGTVDRAEHHDMLMRLWQAVADLFGGQASLYWDSAPPRS